jgi:NAD dependent epimerase/dehydratase family enzyme
MMLGDMADALLLSSQRVVPGQLQAWGYQFQDPDLSKALATLLG